ncbi:MAG: ubiquinol oxidase subunit II [Rhodanobacteraceae bacterium]|nr:MAG: ubiquinol oxidase subunit II [Rhodanobacteraceae bacterium]
MLLAAPALLLGGCQKMVLLHPDGLVASEQSHMMIVTTAILASIIFPVIVACFVVAWRYRASNKRATYDPKWDHSPQVELLVWGWPVLIIMAVGGISWVGTHRLDPYQPLAQVAKGTPVPANDPPLQVDVVSLRWKWLFFYPQYGIATVNQLAAPVDRPIAFKLTSDAMMDSFFVPALAGQIYTMPGMQTQLHAVINKPGSYRGFSANYSGEGFTDMRFKFLGMSQADFSQWVAKVRSSGQSLDTASYEQLAKPERNAPVGYYAHFQPDLFQRILNRCVEPGQVCRSMLMAEDARGGAASDMASMQPRGQPGATADSDPSKAAAPVTTVH